MRAWTDSHTFSVLPKLAGQGENASTVRQKLHFSTDLGELMESSVGILANLPEDLRYLIEPSMKYGVYQFDNDIALFLEQATPRSIQDLTSVADRIRTND